MRPDLGTARRAVGTIFGLILVTLWIAIVVGLLVLAGIAAYHAWGGR